MRSAGSRQDRRSGADPRQAEHLARRSIGAHSVAGQRIARGGDAFDANHRDLVRHDHLDARCVAVLDVAEKLCRFSTIGRSIPSDTLLSVDQDEAFVIWNRPGFDIPPAAEIGGFGGMGKAQRQPYDRDCLFHAASLGGI